MNKEIKNIKTEIKTEIEIDLNRIEFESNEKRRIESYLTKEAQKGNRFAIHDLIANKTGLKVNIEALFPKQECKHKENIGAFEFSFISPVAPQIKDGFRIQKHVCTQCGKTVRVDCKKVKEA